MQIIYLDESLNETTGMYFVGGFSGNASQWRAFTPKWRSILAEYERTSLHMVELRLGSQKAAQRHGEMLSRLGRLPAEHGLIGVVGSVRTGEFRHRTKGNALQILMEGYVLAIIALLDGLKQSLAGEQVKIYFEENEKHTEQRWRAMQYWKMNHRTPSGWSVIADWDVMPKNTQLEAADYFCYAMQQWYTDSNSQKARLTASILQMPYFWRDTSDETMKWWFDYFQNKRDRPIPPLTAQVKKVLRTPPPH